MPPPSLRPTFRQGAMYVLAGLAQLALDTVVFVATSAAGLPVAPANVLGRVGGAALGYWLNGRYTFADAGRSRIGHASFYRFAAAWLALTAVSTLLMAWIAGWRGIGLAWIAKPFVEGGLAVVGFLLSRHWVYR